MDAYPATTLRLFVRNCQSSVSFVDSKTNEIHPISNENLHAQRNDGRSHIDFHLKAIIAAVVLGVHLVSDQSRLVSNGSSNDEVSIGNSRDNLEPRVTMLIGPIDELLEHLLKNWVLGLVSPPGKIAYPVPYLRDDKVCDKQEGSVGAADVLLLYDVPGSIDNVPKRVSGKGKVSANALHSRGLGSDFDLIFEVLGSSDLVRTGILRAVPPQRVRLGVLRRVPRVDRAGRVRDLVLVIHSCWLVGSFSRVCFNQNSLGRGRSTTNSSYTVTSSEWQYRSVYPSSRGGGREARVRKEGKVLSSLSFV